MLWGGALSLNELCVSSNLGVLYFLEANLDASKDSHLPPNKAEDGRESLNQALHCLSEKKKKTAHFFLFYDHMNEELLHNYCSCGISLAPGLIYSLVILNAGLVVIR